MQEDCPYLKDVDQDLQDRSIWSKKDKAIIKRRLGERPAKRNKPYPNSPNPVVNVIDDDVRAKTDQEISMILNAPYIAVFVPLGQDVPQEVVTMAQRGFNTYLRHFSNYRPKKEQAVDTKNARGFAITKVIKDEHPDLGKIPGFDTVDPRDLIVPVGTTDIQKSERAAHILRLSAKDLKEAPSKRGWSRRAVKTVSDKLVQKDNDGEITSIAGSDHDDESVFKITAPLIGFNTSDTKKDELVVWEICHYATKWDEEKSKSIVKQGDKCVAWVCPDVPGELLHIVPWYDEKFETVEVTDPVTLGLRQMEGLPTFDVEEVRKDKAWPFIQHRFEIGDRLWYSSRGIGHLNMDNQIAATAIERAKLVNLDYMMEPMFEGGSLSNQQNVSVRPGAVLPENIKPVKMDTGVLQQLNFEADNQRRDASRRAGAGDAMYSAEVHDSRKLEKTATEVQSDNANKSMVSSASVDRFNDPDRELFRQLWAEMKKMNVRLPVVDNGRFAGYLDETVYSYDFLIIPAASQKTLNPDMQFMKARQIVELNAEYAETTGADIAAGLKLVTDMADPNLGHTLFPDPNSGELPIATTLMQLQQAIEQLSASVEQNSSKADQALQLGSEVADAI